MEASFESATSLESTIMDFRHGNIGRPDCEDAREKQITPCPCQGEHGSGGKPTCRQRPSRRANLTRSSSCGDLLTGFEEESVLDLWSDIERDDGQSVEREPEKCWGCRCIMLQSEQTHVGPSYCSNACAMSSGGGGTLEEDVKGKYRVTSTPTPERP